MRLASDTALPVKPKMKVRRGNLPARVASGLPQLYIDGSNMKSLAKEWQSLRKNLSDAEAKDGERCFYCGAYSILNELIAKDGFTIEQLVSLENEISAKLAPDHDDDFETHNGVPC